MLHRLSLYMSLYTDGSKSGEGDSVKIGYAVFFPDYNLVIKKRINNHSTVFDAEASVIEEAVKYSLDNKITEVLIF